MSTESFEAYFFENPYLKLFFLSATSFFETDFYWKLLGSSSLHNYPAASSSSVTHIKVMTHSVLRMMRLLEKSGFPFYFQQQFQRSYVEVEQVCVLAVLLHDVARAYQGDLTVVCQILAGIFERVPAVDTVAYSAMVIFILAQLTRSQPHFVGETFLLGLAELLDVGVGRYGQSKPDESYVLAALRNVRNVQLRAEVNAVEVVISSKNRDQYFGREVIMPYIEMHGYRDYFKVRIN